MWIAKATHISFSKNISAHAILKDQSFNNTLTNDIVSFEQLGPDCFFLLSDNGFTLKGKKML